MSEFPTGTVTLLFTDIEGSTQLLQHLGERYSTVLTEYRQLLRTACAAHKGHEFGMEGDSLFAVFSRASDAVAAAVEAQRALAAHPWPSNAMVRVRMGLHTGEPDGSESNYTGMDVHRVARIMAAGHGGQVLLSRATCVLVESHLPEGVSLHDLGAHRLKDLPRSEHLTQLVVDGLPADFPPLNSISNRPHNLPAQLTPLIGRDKEVQAVCDLLRRNEVRLITLTGAGGSGKTRLSLQIASELRDLCEDGVFFVNLAPLNDPSLVLSTIAHTLGVKESGGQTLLQTLQEHLREKAVLLVLDNFEQVVQAAPVVAELLAACPRLRVLVTSRSALHLRGEQEFPVLPLALPDLKQLPASEVLSQYAAVELFIQRALAVKPDFAVTNQNAPAVAEICVRLDGLPLAIELAAARVKLFSPQAMLGQLGLTLLTGGARDLPARQQTLRNTIGWSYDLLSEAEKKLFRRLSVFVGGCTLEAAQAVCNPDGDSEIEVLDGIASLVDKSLLRRQASDEGEPRFTMLEMIHEFALEKLEASGEQESTGRAHAEYYLTLSEEAQPHIYEADASWLNRVGVEHDNLRVALQWFLTFDAEQAARLALSLEGFWWVRGHWVEARQILERMIQSGAGISPEKKIMIFNQISSIFQMQGNHTKALEILEEAVQLSRESENKESLAYILRTIGQVITETGVPLEHAQAPLEESLSLYREINHKHGMARTLLGLTEVALRLKDWHQAEAFVEESLTIHREIGDHIDVCMILWRLGEIKRLRGDTASARTLWQESLSSFQAAGRQDWVQYLQPLLDQLNPDAPDLDLARNQARAKEALAGARERGDKQSIAFRLWSLSVVTGHLGDHEEARDYLKEGLSIFLELHKIDAAGGILTDLAVDACRQGNFEAAKQYMEQNVQLHREEGDQVGIINATDSMALLHLSQAKLPEARTIFEQTLAAKEEREDEPGIAWTLKNLGLVAYFQGNYQQSRLWLERSQSIWEHLHPGQYESIQTEIALARGHLERAEGNYSLSHSLYATGLRLLGDPHASDEPHCNVHRHGRWVCYVESLGCLEAAQGQMQRAARLWGAAETLRQTDWIEMSPSERIDYDPAVAAARAALGEPDFTTAWAEGRTMTWEQAVEYALGEDRQDGHE